MKLSDMLFANAMMGEGGGGGGSSDFSTTSVVVVNDTGTERLQVRVPCIDNGEIRDFAYVGIEGGTLSVVMYKGKCEMWGGEYDVSAVSGNAVLDYGIAYISGNATVTFSE